MSIGRFYFAAALLTFLSSSWAHAQGTPPLQFKIVIESGASPFECKLREFEKDVQQFLKEVRKPAAPPAKGAIRIEGLQLQLILDKDGRATLATLQKPLTVEQKIDRMHDEIKALRRDVDAVKAKVDGKTAPRKRASNDANQNEMDEARKRAQENLAVMGALMQKFQAEMQSARARAEAEEAQQRADAARAKALQFLKAVQQPAPPPPNLEQTLQRILQELDDLRREVRGKK